MRKPRVKYSKGEIGRTRVVEDFLPSPNKLRENGSSYRLTDEQSKRFSGGVLTKPLRN